MDVPILASACGAVRDIADKPEIPEDPVPPPAFTLVELPEYAAPSLTDYLDEDLLRA